ncbi:MAG: DUF177 domain-containing protein [Actinomycetota bacterium]|nr:DUF177 domain-containing protein [Actinomycetota bacterium]
MTIVDLRTVRLAPGEQFRDTRAVDLEALELGGQRYAPRPDSPDATLTLTRMTSGLMLELAFEARLVGPCFRCLEETEVTTPISGREYQASDPHADEELRTPYVADERVDLSGWARDAVVLSLPEKILCRPECAGLCPVCGEDLNLAPHEHDEEPRDPRWAVLADLKERL